jgi:hypothetical protein
LNAAVRRHAGVALDEAVLHFDLTAHCINQAAELDDAAAAGLLDDPAVMAGDRRVDQNRCAPESA